MGFQRIFEETKARIVDYLLPAQIHEVYEYRSKAIRGYDPCSFFLEGKAVKGIEMIAFSWQGSTWYFSTFANREAFTKTPEKYAPQYGGYCAYGIANGYKAQTDPTTWIIVNDKLYFSYSQKIKSRWYPNRLEQITKGDQQWPALKSIKKIKYRLR